jgi:cilia- and flagella-associated protein 52
MMQQLPPASQQAYSQPSSQHQNHS